MQIYLPIAELPISILTVLGLSGAVGFVSGLFGVGGGFLLTPLLIFLDIPPAVAVATVAAQVAGSSTTGVLTYWRRRALDLKLGTILVAGGILGTVLGVLFFNHVFAGLIPPDQGTVYLNGQKSSAFKDWRSMTYMFQEDRLFPWRTTAQNYNLNRDYAKADSAEMRAMLSLVEAWDPIAYIDLHATNGAQFEHDISIQVEPLHAGDEGLRAAGLALRDGVIAP